MKISITYIWLFCKALESFTLLEKNLSVRVKLTNHLKLFFKLCSFLDNPLSNTSDLSTSSVSQDQSLCDSDTEKTVQCCMHQVCYFDD